MWRRCSRFDHEAERQHRLPQSLRPGQRTFFFFKRNHKTNSTVPSHVLLQLAAHRQPEQQPREAGCKQVARSSITNADWSKTLPSKWVI